MNGQRLIRWILTLLWGLAAWIMSPETSSGQTPPASDDTVKRIGTAGLACQPPRRCRSAEEVNNVADALCARARAKEARYDDVVTEAAKQRRNAEGCERAFREVQELVVPLQHDNAELVAQNANAWIWELAAGLTGAVAVGTVWCFAEEKCPEAAAWSLVGALGVGLVVQSIRRWL